MEVELEDNELLGEATLAKLTPVKKPEEGGEAEPAAEVKTEDGGEKTATAE